RRRGLISILPHIRAAAIADHPPKARSRDRPFSRTSRWSRSDLRSDQPEPPKSGSDTGTDSRASSHEKPPPCRSRRPPAKSYRPKAAVELSTSQSESRQPPIASARSHDPNVPVIDG